MLYVFGDFELDTQRYELRKAGSAQSLEPQGFNVLAYLVVHRARVVSKSELLEHLWPQQHVTEATLIQRLVAVRRALEDDGRTQRYIRTVHGRGYRFVAEVVEPTASLPPIRTRRLGPQTLPQSAGKGAGMFVGREAEIARLQECLGQALQGQRQIVLLSGEAGIGKSTLVDAFVEQAQTHTALWIGRGQCIEHYGAGEAYLPLLEALGRLGRSPARERLVAALRQQAPSWLAHLPALASRTEEATLPRQMPGLTRERMLRELADALESVTATQPLLLVLEDVHWSDVSTVDWLTYVARRRDPAQLFILGTYRPSDAMAQQHPLPSAVQELHRQGHALLLPLPYWTLAEVTAYLVQRFGALPFSEAVVQLLHQRTKGHPFFLVALLEAMPQQGSLERADTDVSALSQAIPESIRHLIAYQLEALSGEEQAVLEAACVVGESFATAEVAAVIGHTVDAVETRCDALARKGQFVYALGLDTWPDGTVATRYGFRHALYHEVLYTRLAPGRRLRVHQQIGLLKERAYGAQAPDIAAELALHFVRGQEPERGVQYLRAAAYRALQRCAYQEALQHIDQAFLVLPQLPEGADRTQQALTLHFIQGRALTFTRGYAGAEVEHAYAQAYHLGHQCDDTPPLFPVLHGLWSFYYMRAEHQRARELAERCLRIARQTNEVARLTEAHYALGGSLFLSGQLEAARQSLAQWLARYAAEHNRRGHAGDALQDPQVLCLAMATWTWWYLGYPEQAHRYCDQALTLARQLGEPLTLGFALLNVLYLAHVEGDATTAQPHADALITLATEHRFLFCLASGTIIRGWALVAQQHKAEGLAVLQQGLEMYRATGAALAFPYYLSMLGEAYGAMHQVDQGLEVVREAFAVVERTGEVYYVAELHRLHGVLLLRQPTSGDRVAAAEQCFEQAIEVARGQQARALELRAALSLGRLWQGQGKHAVARQLVSQIYGWFTEGWETSDLRTASAFLEEAS